MKKYGMVLAAYPNVISQTPCNILAVFNNI